MREKRFLHFFHSDLDLRPLDLNFAPQLLLPDAMFPLNYNFYGFPVSRKSAAWEVKTNGWINHGQTDEVHGGPHNETQYVNQWSNRPTRRD